MYRYFLPPISMVFAVFCSIAPHSHAQQVHNANHSVARNWNEALLAAIRIDFARPTVHARNLYHSSALMYDAWAVYDDTADLYFLNNGHTACDLSASQRDQLIASATAGTSTRQQARENALSYGVYRLLRHRFEDSPGAAASYVRFNALADELGLDRNFDSSDLSSGDAAALGIYLADCIIQYGLSDGANEQNDYANSFYNPVNEPLEPALAGTPGLNDVNRWQPLKLDIFIDQAGNEVDTPPFLGAEWGAVAPFALTEQDLSIYQRDGNDFYVYHDPGAPALLEGEGAMPNEYLWGHTLVALWSSHLDPTDGVMMDISPASIGNSGTLPSDIASLQDFYDALEGGSTDQGHDVNPATGQPYTQQMVPRGDYTRVLAEFWADGPDSETPPGHWFTIFNEAVNDHPDFSQRFEGQGQPLDDLEWDVKAYFMLGGAMHDAAVAAWGIKGWYDYIRPVSAIRYMASLGQSSFTALDNYHVHGLPLQTGFIEVVEVGDALAGAAGEHVGKIKLYAWRGPDAITETTTDTAGVGWILAENWWPYQRPSFVTPPFAGYVSGHSTFSRAAAEVLTLLTGDEYFPGGMAEFVATQDEFLVFEDGPSVDVILQWATYRDASDQTSLSRIWGGIHPPVDDIPGRLVGETIGQNAFAFAKTYFDGTAVANEPEPEPVAPSPSASSGGGGSLSWTSLLLLLMLAVWMRGSAHNGRAS